MRTVIDAQTLARYIGWAIDDLVSGNRASALQRLTTIHEALTEEENN